jgi:hypothetical protein
MFLSRRETVFSSFLFAGPERCSSASLGEGRALGCGIERAKRQHWRNGDKKFGEVDLAMPEGLSSLGIRMLSPQDHS